MLDATTQLKISLAAVGSVPDNPTIDFKEDELLEMRDRN